MNPLWYQLLERYVGMTEARDTARIAELGRIAQMEKGWDPRKIPWCDIIADGAFALSGMPYTPSRLARSWHTDNPAWGEKISRIEDLRLGDVVVLNTQPPPHGHMGFFAGRSNGKLRILGGNQDDAVSVAPFSESLFVAGFRPTAEPNPRTAFFNCVRQAPFPGHLTQAQVDGLNLILAYFDQWPDQDLRRFAYVLATVFHETGARFEPITEYGSDAYLRGKRYWPWIGRGYVQLTWEANYRKMGELIGVDLIANPEKANDPDVAVKVLFEGMYRAESGIGDFTQKALDEFFSATRTDPEGARQIVNGTDKASLIAGYYHSFLKALQAAKRVADYVGIKAPPTPEPVPESPRPPAEPEPVPELPAPVPVPLEPVTGGLSPDAGLDRHLPPEITQRLSVQTEIEGLAGGHFEAVYHRVSVRWVAPGQKPGLVRRMLSTIGETDMPTAKPHTEVVPVESAWKSKINWTQAVALLASVLVVFGVELDAATQASIVVVIQAIAGVVTWVLRTWFTATVTPASVT